VSVEMDECVASGVVRSDALVNVTRPCLEGKIH
jgi:hypothetical protein